MSDLPLIEEAHELACKATAKYGTTPSAMANEIRDILQNKKEKEAGIFESMYLYNMRDDPISVIQFFVKHQKVFGKWTEEKVICYIAAAIWSTVELYEICSEVEGANIGVGVDIGDQLRKLMFAIEYPEYRNRLIDEGETRRQINNSRKPRANALTLLAIDYIKSTESPGKKGLIDYFYDQIECGVITDVEYGSADACDEDRYIEWNDRKVRMLKGKEVVIKRETKLLLFRDVSKFLYEAKKHYEKYSQYYR